MTDRAGCPLLSSSIPLKRQGGDLVHEHIDENKYEIGQKFQPHPEVLDGHRILLTGLVEKHCISLCFCVYSSHPRLTLGRSLGQGSLIFMSGGLEGAPMLAF